MATRTRRFELGEELGRGALGRVVRVHRDDGTVLAGKILHDSHRDDATARARFASEATILGGLKHPNLVVVHGLEEIDGRDVLLMELVDGPSLATVIATCDPLPRERIVALTAGIASGLEAAHHAGLIHRDLKPANILVTAADRPKIVDFGMARATSLAGVDPDAFTLVGTPDYMAPEAVDPLAVDARSDLYSLGCILHELMTGRPPYSRPTAFAILEAHRSAPIPEIADPERRHPPALLELARALMAKSPADRPQSAAAVLGHLEALGLVGGETALVAKPERIRGGVCARCGEDLIAGIPVCFGCGLEQPQLEKGDMSLFVVGPGEETAKLDAELRQKLLDWLRGNPSLGLDPEPLAESVPRLPFPLVTGVSAGTAEKLAATLGSLGFECQVARGGRFALKAMRAKAWRLGGRLSAIVFGSSYFLIQLSWFAGPLLLASGIGALGAGWYLAGRDVVRVENRLGEGLPEPYVERLSRIAGVLPTIDAKRHRDSLRAVVQRVLDLREVVAESEGESLDDDLCQLLDLAVLASARIDELEGSFSTEELRAGGREIREALRERDAWSARLLSITAFLEALRARYAALDATAHSASEAENLAELRTHIEALEEVMS